MQISPERDIPVNESHEDFAARCELIPVGRNTWVWTIPAAISVSFNEFFSMFNAADSDLIVRYSSIKLISVPGSGDNLAFEQAWLCRTESAGGGNAWTIGQAAPDTTYGTACKLDPRNPAFPYVMPTGISGLLYPTVTIVRWLTARWYGGQIAQYKHFRNIEMLPKTFKGQQFYIDEGEGILVKTTSSSWTGSVAAQVVFTIDQKRRKR